MRAELLVFLIVAVLAAIPLIQIATTGMQVQEIAPMEDLKLENFPLMFYERDQFTASIGVSETKLPAEPPAINLMLNEIPEYYYIILEELYGEEVAKTVDFQRDLRNEVYAGKYDYTKQDGIIIGPPCNPLVADLLGITHCETHFREGDGLVKLLRAHGNNYLVITGYNGEDILRAAVYFDNLVKERDQRGTTVPIDKHSDVYVIKQEVHYTGTGEVDYIGRIGPVYQK